MNEINGHKYTDLGYPHEEIQFLLDKISKGNVLSAEQYRKLITEIGLDNISTFDGYYESLKEKPDLVLLIEQRLANKNYATNEYVGALVGELSSLIRSEVNKLNDKKADNGHEHNDLYYSKSEIDLRFDGVEGDIDLTHYVRTEDLAKELLAYVTADYLTLQLKDYANKEHNHVIDNITGLQEEFDKKANVDEVYNKEEVDDLLENIEVSGDGGEHSHDEFIKKDEANELFSKIEDLEAVIELVDTLEKDIDNNKEECSESIVNLQTLLNNKINSDRQDLEAQINNSVTELGIEINKKADKDHTHSIYYSKSEIDDKLVNLGSGGSINLEGYLKQEDLLPVQQDIEKLQSDIEGKADKNHIHDFAIEDIEGLQEILDAKANKGETVEIPDNIMETIEGKADKVHTHDEYALKEHEHEYEYQVEDIIGLQEVLDSKANADDVLSEEEIIEFIKENTNAGIAPDHTHEEYALKEHEHDNYANKQHEHGIEEISNLQTVLDEKAMANMVYTKEQVDKKLVDLSTGGSINLEGFVKQSDLYEGLSGKSDLGHGHEISEITDLAQILDNKASKDDIVTQEKFNEAIAGKAESDHNHDDVYSQLGHTHEEFYTKEEIGIFVSDVFKEEAITLRTEVNAYTDSAIGELTKDAPDDLRTFANVAEAINNQSKTLNEELDEMNGVLFDKADVVHSHSEYATVEDENARDIFTTTELTVSALGGIQAGANLNGLTIKEILAKLLYPYIAPTIGITCTPNGGLFEKGNNQVITNVRAVVTKRSEKITKIEVLQGSNVLGLLEEGIENGGTFNFEVNVPVNSVNVQLTGRVTDASGTVKTATSAAFNFIYPYYVGVCGEDENITEALVKGLEKRIEAKGTKNISYTTNQQRMILAYPKSYGVIKKILDPNSFDVTDTFTRTEIRIVGLDGTSQSYYVYVNNASTVSGFTMTFNY